MNKLTDQPVIPIVVIKSQSKGDSGESANTHVEVAYGTDGAKWQASQDFPISG